MQASVSFKASFPQAQPLSLTLRGLSPGSVSELPWMVREFSAPPPPKHLITLTRLPTALFRNHQIRNMFSWVYGGSHTKPNTWETGRRIAESYRPTWARIKFQPSQPELQRETPVSNNGLYSLGTSYTTQFQCLQKTDKGIDNKHLQGGQM